MNSSRPYLLRAVLEWISDNGLTPHLVVNAQIEGVEVPRQFVRDGQIVLNIAAPAVCNFDISPAEVSFSARFGGRAYHIHVPMPAVQALYAQENGKGMVFPEDEPGQEPDPAPTSEADQKRIQRSALRLVK